MEKFEGPFLKSTTTFFWRDSLTLTSGRAFRFHGCQVECSCRWSEPRLSALSLTKTFEWVFCAGCATAKGARYKGINYTPNCIDLRLFQMQLLAVHDAFFSLLSKIFSTMMTAQLETKVIVIRIGLMSKNGQLQSSRIFVPEKWLWVQNGWIKKFKKELFDTSLKTKNSKFVILIYPFLCQRNRSRTQKALFLGWDEVGSLGLHGIFPKLNITATNPENSMLRFFIMYRKNIISKFSVELFQKHDATTQKSFLRDKKPPSFHLTFLT